MPRRGAGDPPPPLRGFGAGSRVMSRRLGTVLVAVAFAGYAWSLRAAEPRQTQVRPTASAEATAVKTASAQAPAVKTPSAQATTVKKVSTTPADYRQTVTAY